MNGTETKQTSSNNREQVKKEEKGKSRKGAKNKKRERDILDSGRTVRGFHWSSLDFHGKLSFSRDEGKRFIDSVRTRKVSQPTNELLVEPRDEG